ncbi:unnamed protein product, partial [Symbiodinium necroappetens]
MAEAPTNIPMESHMHWEHEMQLPQALFVNHPSVPVPDDFSDTDGVNLEFAEFIAVDRVRCLCEEEMSKLCGQVFSDRLASSESSESGPPVQRCSMKFDSGSAGSDDADGRPGELRQFHLSSFTRTARVNLQGPLETSDSMRGSRWCAPKGSQDTIWDFASDTETSPKPAGFFAGVFAIFGKTRKLHGLQSHPRAGPKKAPRMKNWMCFACRPCSKPY